MEFLDKIEKLLKKGENVDVGVSPYDIKPKYNPGDTVTVSKSSKNLEDDLKAAKEEDDLEKIKDIKTQIKTQTCMRVQARKVYFDDDEKPHYKYMVEPYHVETGTSMNSLWYDENELKDW